ncbi:MAG: hypothetical protein BGO01_06025 [Armatimonadetes bacterium 55-13]|nr:MAG: hypothetical protein BGO01_06025 [Armatimonadetes bacterium 55-13]
MIPLLRFLLKERKRFPCFLQRNLGNLRRDLYGFLHFFYRFVVFYYVGGSSNFRLSVVEENHESNQEGNLNERRQQCLIELGSRKMARARDGRTANVCIEKKSCKEFATEIADLSCPYLDGFP